jgi:D-lactate dehydrogenase (cytochrome)
VIAPGVTRKELNEHLRDMGLFFPIDPGADASLGAWWGRALRHQCGALRDHEGQRALAHRGDAQRRRGENGQARQENLRGLRPHPPVRGLEGTLGIVTEITLKLHGIPEAISAGICPFPSSAPPATPPS